MIVNVECIISYYANFHRLLPCICLINSMHTPVLNLANKQKISCQLAAVQVESFGHVSTDVTLGINFKVYCDMEETDGGRWTLVWQHSYQLH